MKITKLLYKNKQWELDSNDENFNEYEAHLVLGYGCRNILEDPDFFSILKEKFPQAEIALSSSSGEIFCDEVFDETVSVTVIGFSSTKIKTAQIDINDFKNSYEAGKTLISTLPSENLRWVFVLSDGSKVNGSKLVEGLNEKRPDNVLISGGLAGDGDKFEKTIVGLNQVPSCNKIVAVGFYGNALELSHASFGGWESFGLERTVTHSQNNILSEIDHKNALDLYKTYLGKYAEELPKSALLFPLSLKLTEDSEPIVRTILSINEKKTR